MSSAPADVLRAELERAYDLEQMQQMAQELLALDPHDVGGATSKAAFARALVDRCARDESLEALADAVILTDPTAQARLNLVFDGKPMDDLQPGMTVANFRIQKKLNDEGFGAVFMAAHEGKQVSLKVLRDAKVRDRKGLQRFLLAQRALKRVDHPSVQKILAAGTLPDGRPYLASEMIDGQFLSVRIGRTGAMHINEAKTLLESVAAGLDAAHRAGIMHSDIRPEHVVVVRREGQLQGVLVDFAVDRLAAARSGAMDSASLLVLVGSARNIAPERARSASAADVRSDVYALGCLAYEVLTGKAPFTANSPIELLLSHLSSTPDAPSKVAPRGWVIKDVDPVIARALSADPAARYESATAFVDALVEAATGKKLPDVTAEQFAERCSALNEQPNDDERATAVEQAGGHGVAWSEVLAAVVEVMNKTSDTAAKKSLGYRAARIAHVELKELARAREIYEKLVEIDADDAVAKSKVAELRRALATPEERAEILLEEAEVAESADRRAEIYRELARVYEKELSDNENALVAATEALTSAPSVDEYSQEVERLAGSDSAKWNEVLSTLSQSAQNREKTEAARLYVLAGRWYAEKLSRPDYAANCFSQALTLDPDRDDALEGAEAVYRKAAQWPELVAVLAKRAELQSEPERARTLRAECADVLESKVGDLVRARELAQRVLEQDPAQQTALEVLERIYLSTDDHRGLISLLEKKAESLAGSAKSEALCELAESYEDRLKDDDKAAIFYEKARVEDPKNIAALKGLERLYARTSANDKLLSVLEAQLEVVSTPRQKMDLLLRIAAIYEEEFVDHAKAASSFEQVLAIDAGNDAAMTGLSRLYRITRRFDALVELLGRHADIVESTERKADLHAQRGRTLLDPLNLADKAREAFDKALAADPNNIVALEGAAKTRAMAGDSTGAAEALEAVAQLAKSPAEKADALVRAGRILEESGASDAAIERYKRALDLVDDYAPATSRLRGLYASRGDAQGAIDMLQREIEAADGTNQRAKLWGEVAKIYRDRVKDSEKALESAQKAVLLDSTNDEAAALLGELRFDQGQFAEAAQLLGPRSIRAKDLPREEGLRIVLRHGEALAKSGDEASALEAFSRARELAPGDVAVLSSVADAAFGIGRHEQARTEYEALLAKHDDALSPELRVRILTRLGRAQAKLGDGAAALRSLIRAVELDGANADAVDALVDVYSQQGRWEDVAKVKRQRAESAGTDVRADLFVELGELYATKLNDKAQAGRAFMSALEARPDDRRLLMRLMQLYTESQDWGRLVEVILRMADLVDDATQLARYYLTAAQLCHQQLNRSEEAATYYEKSLEFEPGSTRALEGLVEVRVGRKEYAVLETTVKKTLSKITGAGAPGLQAKGFVALGTALAKQPDRADDAIAALEKAQELDSSLALGEVLAPLYLKEPKKHVDKAIRAQRAVLATEPTVGEHYRVLRKLYTTARKPDEAWCLCQALVALKSAEADEDNFFKKFRADAPATAKSKVNEELWSKSLMHATQDPLITSIFALITPAVLALRAQPIESYGVGESDLIDPSTHESAAARTIHYAAGTMGMRVPPVYARPSDDSGINVMLTSSPGFVLGNAALGAGPAQPLAFIVGNNLAYLRAGHFLRQVVPTGTGLRAWLFAACSAVNPAFPVPDELANTVIEPMNAVKEYVVGPAFEQLTSLVTKLLNVDNTLDLKTWSNAVDLTADRVGFLLANDLPRALSVIRATPDDLAPISAKDRMRELIAFAVSDEYFALRQRLGIAIQGG
ncbi:MAG: protein kinase [Deltaproteobacteria bacterium]|nr:protein kinase [Deltaproteobacteria bacterium]